MPTPATIERHFSDLSDSAMRNLDLDWGGVVYGSLTWSDVLASPRVLIVSEAGTGKTYECQQQRLRLWASGESAFWVELASLHNGQLDSTLGGEELERFNGWLNDESKVATFFLDSVDELLLTKASFEHALRTVSRGIGARGARARFVVTSRPTDFDRQALTAILPFPERQEQDSEPGEPGQGFVDVAMGRQAVVRRTDKETRVPVLRTVSLVPFTTPEVQTFVAGRGVKDPQAFADALVQRNALSFARRPQDLIELANDWIQEGRLRTHRDQVRLNITVKLRGAERRNERELPHEKAVSGARRIALAMLLARRLSLRHGADSDSEDGLEDVVDPREVLHDWTSDEVKALLERPLFGHAGYGRVRFHHRSVVEFLAAEQLAALIDQGMRWRDVADLLFATTPQGVAIVKPTLRPTTVWLAATHSAVLNEVMRCHPEALLQHGDPESLGERERLSALLAYIDRVGNRQREGIEFPPAQVQRVACAEVLAALPDIWHAGVTSPDVRKLLLQLFAAMATTDGSAIAFEALTDAHGDHLERLLAAEVLVASNDGRLPAVAHSLASDAAAWPDGLTTGIAVRLLPEHLTPDQLCAVLDRTTAGRNDPGRDLARMLTHQVSSGLFDSAFLSSLRRGLVASVVAGMHWSRSEYPQHRTTRPELAELLAAVCAHQLASPLRSAELLCAIVVATLVNGRERSEDSYANGLRQQALSWPPSLRQTAFIATQELLQGIHPVADARERFHTTYQHGLIGLTSELDGQWVLQAVANRANPFTLRATLLEAALRGVVPPAMKHVERVRRLCESVRDEPGLLAHVQLMTAKRQEDPEMRRLRAQDARRTAKQVKKEADRRQGWDGFAKKVVQDPDEMFSDAQAYNTAWHLWDVMRRNDDSGRDSGWNRSFLEKHLSVDIANRLKQALRPIWRNDSPTLPHERPTGQRNTTLLRWGMGNAALMAEAEDSGWAEALSENEATLASRYVPIELNRFPPWLPSLATAHPGAVRATLVQIIDDELQHLHDPESHPATLQYLEYTEASIQALVLPHLETWVEDNAAALASRSTPVNPTYGFERIVRLVLKHGDVRARTVLRALSLNALTQNPTGGWELLWFNTLFAIDPTAATEILEQRLEKCPVGKLGQGAQLLGGLFGDRHEALRANPRDAAFSPDVRLRLTRLAYNHVRREDDVEHIGSYTPDARDAAENGRDALLAALLDAEGPGSWEAKMAMADDPIIGVFADRARAITAEHAASQAEGNALSLTQVQAVLAGGVAPPLNRDQMALLLEHRLDDLEDLLRSDTSPRETWARITEEREMRRLIAHELEAMARDTYIVDQEAVSAEEKETDIRLVSTVPPETGVIELKLGSRSGADLRDTIQNQLARKYLQPDRRRAGCLLVTVRDGKGWDHPDTAERLDVEGLRRLLAEEAIRVQNALRGKVRITTRVLDLRPPLGVERLNKKASTKKRP